MITYNFIKNIINEINNDLNNGEYIIVSLGIMLYTFFTILTILFDIILLPGEIITLIIILIKRS